MTRATSPKGTEHGWKQDGQGKKSRHSASGRPVFEFQEPPLITPKTQDNTTCFLLGKIKYEQAGPSRRELPGSLKEEDFDMSLEGGAGRAIERTSAWDKGQSTASGWFRAF